MKEEKIGEEDWDYEDLLTPQQQQSAKEFRELFWKEKL